MKLPNYILQSMSYMPAGFGLATCGQCVHKSPVTYHKHDLLLLFA